ncbi:solute carrier family 22 member 7-like isoform X1 [Tachysurus fulvidraco]|uniref:solute carrier family 22 member 7-like isoform X1 n=1 Tax=Tachysurus fulvidraco TaxID=1234273 RepID=UPI000F4DC13F|nr:solute carrier family 22 member 7-like isoform X1 [Tachysurus fulvidraco]
MKFEDLLEDLDGFGRFQKMIVFLSFIGRFTLPCHFLLNNYIGAIPPHHCNLGSVDRNLTQEQILNINIPRQEDGTFTSCHMFSEPQFHLLDELNVTNVSVVECQNGWTYDNSTFISTLATEWDLVCENKGMNKVMATIFFVGVMLGAAIFGSLSDRYGRKSMLLVSYVLALCFAMASVFSSSIIMFAVLRFFTGLSITGIVIVTSVLNVEWVSIESRKLVGVIDSLSWTFGYMVLPVMAYGVRDWRWLTVTVTLPLTVALISWRWVPESARWLIANGKVEKAQYYLQKCAEMNKRTRTLTILKPEVLSSIVSEGGNRTYTYLDLMRTPKMRRLALMTGVTWYGVASTYYGISFNIKGFGLDLYLNQFLYGTVEIPAKVVVYLLLDRIGRRCTEVCGLLLSGCALITNVFIPKDQWIVRSVIGVLGKGFASIAFSTLVLYSSELYPTVIRQNGMGYNSFMGRLGVALAPLILLLDDVWTHLSQVILCIIALIAGVVASQLPETMDRCLPETIEDIEGTRTGHVVVPVWEKRGQEQENGS